MEIWKPCISLAGHEASSLGRIKSVPFYGPMPGGGVRKYGGKARYGVWHKDSKRYVLVHGTKNYKVARLVCEAFHGPPPPDAVCMHLDEDSRNNRPENLAWGTQRENMNAPGFIRARRFAARRLSESDVVDIRASKDRPCDLARRYGVAPCTISNIKAGRMRK